MIKNSLLIFLCFCVWLFSLAFSGDSGIISGGKQFVNPDSTNVPEEIIRPSSVGEVHFPHRFHIEDLEIECEECHHQIRAEELNIPHMDYFDDFWIDCEICHKDSQQRVKDYRCSDCHRNQPVDIADETLSAKVVAHNKCWGCHDIGTGAEASAGCKLCHTGEKSK